MATDWGHGAVSPVIVECDAPDTGSLTIPAVLLGPYVDESNWGYSGFIGTGVLTRYRRVSADTAAGPVALETSSSITLNAHPWSHTF